MNLFKLKTKSSKDLFALYISSLGNQAIGVVRGFIVAGILGPADFGMLKAIQLITMLDKFGSLGFRPAAIREVTHFKSQSNVNKANKIRNVAYSCEFLLSTLLFFIGVCSSLFFDSISLVTMVLLASGHLFSSKILGIFNTNAIIEKKIVLYSKILFWSGLISSLLIIVTVPFLRIYAVLGIPMLAAVISCWIYYNTSGSKFEFVIKKNELIRLIRIGFPLTLFTLSYGLLQYSERILISVFLGLEKLGLYSFAIIPSVQLISLMLLTLKIRSVNLYELLGEKRFPDAHRMVVRETMILLLIGTAAIPVMWLALDILVPRFLGKYSEAIVISKILFLMIPFRISSCYSNMVLLSSVVNKQSLMWPLQFSVTVIFITCVLILKYSDIATFVNIVIVDIATYAVFNVLCLLLYKKYFMNVYLKANNTLKPEQLCS